MPVAVRIGNRSSEPFPLPPRTTVCYCCALVNSRLHSPRVAPVRRSGPKDEQATIRGKVRVTGTGCVEKQVCSAVAVIGSVACAASLLLGPAGAGGPGPAGDRRNSSIQARSLRRPWRNPARIPGSQRPSRGSTAPCGAIPRADRARRPHIPDERERDGRAEHQASGDGRAGAGRIRGGASRPRRAGCDQGDDVHRPGRRWLDSAGSRLGGGSQRYCPVGKRAVDRVHQDRTREFAPISLASWFSNVNNGIAYTSDPTVIYRGGHSTTSQ